jgi:hypothetical protein
MESTSFRKLVAANAAGESAQVWIGDYLIEYEPSVPIGTSGTTYFTESGFLIGPYAFSSREETFETVLQEVFQSLTSPVSGDPSIEIDSGLVEAETLGAHEYAEKAYSALREER